MSKDLIRGFLLAHGAPSEVLNALADLREACVETGITVDFLPENIRLWPLSVRTSNCLANASIKTQTQLLSLSESEILKIPNFGRKSLNEIKQLIRPRVFAGVETSVKLVHEGMGWYSYPTSEAEAI